jgi:phosphatidylserine/phosphatidylglycerophosphate/cardiolipin synthase-like enzyme
MTATHHDFEAAGSLFLRSRDVVVASRAVQAFMLDPSEANRTALERLSIDLRLADDLRRVFPTDPDQLERMCDLGAAWAAGRLSVTPPPSWQPVVTGGDFTADGIDRATAETLTGLIVGAHSTIRLFSPYVDATGLEVLTVSVAAATRRGVSVTLGYAKRANHDQSVAAFVDRIARSGEGRRLRVVPIGTDRPFPHLKLLAVDGMQAYIGSANLTWPALTSNVEFGALVDGEPVRVLERCFDELIEPENDDAAKNVERD